MTPERQKAWALYFETGEREPLVKAYWNSIRYIAWARYPTQVEDMTQVGLIGLLKAIKRLDITRLKSADAWVFLNAKGMMYNVRKQQATVSLDALIYDNGETSYLDRLSREDATSFEVDDLLAALPHKEATIIRKVVLEDRPLAELAEEFGCTVASVSQNKTRGLKKLELALVA